MSALALVIFYFAYVLGMVFSLLAIIYYTAKRAYIDMHSYLPVSALPPAPARKKQH